jgi:predicted PurR-regulated permease PerM
MLIVFAGVLLALGLSSLCDLVERRTGLRRRWSLPLVLLSFVIVLCLGIWLRGAAIEDQFNRLQESLPSAATELLTRMRTQHWAQWLLAHGFGPDQGPSIVDILPRVTRAVSGTLGYLGGLFVILFLGIVIAAEPQTYRRGFTQLFPRSAQFFVSCVVDKLLNELRLWLLARVACMGIVGFLVFLGLLALRVPLAGSLGILAGVLTFIPNVGPILSAVPPILLAFAMSPSCAILVMLLFWAVHASEGFLITPIANKAAVNLAPALTLAIQLLLAFVAGVLGVALATPLTIVIIVLVETVYKEKILREHPLDYKGGVNRIL